MSDGQLDESKLTLRELTLIRETLITSLSSIYHARIDYPGFNVAAPVPGGAPTPHEGRGVVYQTASEVPINRAGEVEDEAVSHEQGKANG